MKSRLHSSLLSTLPSGLLPGLLTLGFVATLGLGPVSAQEIRYRVREYQMPIALVIPGMPQQVAAEQSAPAEVPTATEAPADAEAADVSPKASPATEAELATPDAAASAEHPEGDAAAAVEAPADAPPDAPEGEAVAAPPVEAEAAPTPEATQPVVTLAEVLAQGDYHLVEAIVQAEALQSALMSPLNDESLWRVLRDQAIDQPRDSMRTGVVLAIDSTLAIKRLPADLSEHLAQAVGRVATRQGATSQGEDTSPAVLRRALIDVLAEELECESPDWSLVHRLLTSIDELDQPLAADDAPSGAVDSSSDAAEAPSPQA